MKRNHSFIILMVLMVGTAAFGTTLYVDDDSPGGDGASWETAYRLLQDAIAASEPNDVIRVAQGVYIPNYDQYFGWGFRPAALTSLLGGYSGLGAVDPNQRDIERFRTVISGDVDGDDVPVSDASLLKDDPLRDDNRSSLVVIDGSRDQNDVVLDGFEFSGAHGYGAVAISNAMVTIRDCLFVENYTGITEFGQAGAIYGGWQNYTVGNPAVRVINCRFDRNASGHSAGAIYGFKILIEDCEFVGNYARSDGGALDLHGDCVVHSCKFIKNRSLSRGGGIYMEGQDISVVGSVFRDNRASWGGGVFNWEYATIDTCRFLGNVAERGGAAYTLSQGVIFRNSLFCGNRAAEFGGVILARENSFAKFIDCTVNGNRATRGSFIATLVVSDKWPCSQVDLFGCIVSDSGQPIWNECGNIQISYSNVECLDDSVNYDPSSGISEGAGNVDNDPCFIDPGYWDANDTPDDPNDDFFIVGDYHLKSQAGRWDSATGNWVLDEVTSPCIDAGDPNSPMMYEPFPNGGRINMGAYGGTVEASKSYFGASPCQTIIAGDINGDCRVDFKDLYLLCLHWLESAQTMENQ